MCSWAESKRRSNALCLALRGRRQLVQFLLAAKQRDERSAGVGCTLQLGLLGPVAPPPPPLHAGCRCRTRLTSLPYGTAARAAPAGGAGDAASTVRQQPGDRAAGGHLSRAGLGGAAGALRAAGAATGVGVLQRYDAPCSQHPRSGAP